MFHIPAQAKYNTSIFTKILDTKQALVLTNVGPLSTRLAQN